MIYSVSENLKELSHITASSFTDLTIWERLHIQEWVRKNPGILGEDLLVLAMEFDRFIQSADRLDLLAVDLEGNLVVIELKRSPLAGSADMQALRYAAMVSSMTMKTLAPYYVDYLRKHCDRESTPQEAAEEIRNFIKAEGFQELSSKPRIILCSEGFSQEITTTVLWLNKAQLDITCVEITPYRYAETTFLVPRVIIPLAETKQYLVELKSKEESVQEATTSRKGRVMQFLLESGRVKAGDSILLNAFLPSWLIYDPEFPKFRATITGKLGRSNAVRWEADGQEYSISRLTWNIFTSSHPEQKEYGGLSGVDHWTDTEGRTLAQLAEEAQTL